MTVVSNDVFKQTMVEYFEYKDEKDLSHIISQCDFIITDSGQFTYRIWNQTTIVLDIRVPLPLMKKVEESWDKITILCKEAYPNDEDHALMSVVRGMKLSNPKISNKDEEQPGISVPGGQVYDNLIAKVHKSHVDNIEKDYILEACYCAQRGYRLAAATMIGCAAERLLTQLCNAYLSYLNNGNGTEREITNFEEKVVNAKKAHARLDGFLRTVQNSEKLFEEIGLENSNLHFAFLDIMRQVRNESGHPTGVKVSAEDVSSIFANYQLLIERVHPVITKLPSYKK